LLAISDQDTLVKMTTLGSVLFLSTAAACGDATGPHGSVAGTMHFVLGGTPGASSSSVASLDGQARASAQSAALLAGDEYIVSPRKAKITFTSVVFKGADGATLGTSTLNNCTVTYDRSLASGSGLLDCAFTVPIGDVYQIAVYFDKTLQLLVSDSKFGIYSDPLVATGYSTTSPAVGAGFVPFTITIGDNSGSRATPVLFASPISVVAGSTPTLYITTDMIQTFQLKVNAGGTTLTAGAGNDPVALFGGPTPGSSSFYSNANAIDSYKVGSVNAFQSLRIFYDQAGVPLFLMRTSVSGNMCGVDAAAKGAWASPPMNDIGGWLGRDASHILAWAVPQTTSFSTYGAYFVMAEPTAIGQTTTLKCKATASPPPPADGKTYASGAPSISSPDATVTLILVAR
jgi:hypothetical protein